jgi:hypothetical protein
VDAADEGLVHVLSQVGGEDDDALVIVHALEQVRHLDVGVAVMGVAHGGALAEQGVGLAEDEDGVAGGGLVEDAGQVLLGLADVRGEHPGQVALVEVEAQGVGEDVGGHGLGLPDATAHCPLDRPASS